MGEITSSKVSVGGLQVVYSASGSGTRPFVLVHGYSGCRQDFDPVLPALGALGRTLVPDLRGHGESGRSPDPADYRFDTLVADLGGFLDALEVERCDLLGHSMGGMLALRFALARPERVASLVLMNTTPRALEGVDRALFARAWELARGAGMEVLQQAHAALLRNDPARSAADRGVEAAWGEGYWEHHRRRFVSMDPEAYARLGPSMLEQRPLTDRLGEIRCPTLVLVGEHDRGFLAGTDLLERGIPGAVRATLPDAEHHPHRENRQAWLGAVTAHLARARGGLSPDR